MFLRATQAYTIKESTWEERRNPVLSWIQVFGWQVSHFLLGIPFSSPSSPYSFIRLPFLLLLLFLLHHLCLCLLLLLLLFLFLFFLLHLLLLQSEETYDYIIPVSEGCVPTELLQWTAYEETSLVSTVSSSWWLSMAPSPPSVHQCQVPTCTSFFSMPFPHSWTNSTFFSHTASGEVTCRYKKPQNSSYN